MTKVLDTLTGVNVVTKISKKDFTLAMLLHCAYNYAGLVQTFTPTLSIILNGTASITDIYFE